MADLLDSIQSELRARLQELRPLALEYERLEAALAALASPVGNATAQRSRRARARRAASTTRARHRSSKRSPRGQNKTLIFDAIRSAPHATVSDIQAATGIDKPVIYDITRKGIEDGELDTVVLAGGIQGFAVMPTEKATEPPKPARRRSQRKRSAPATAKPSAAEAQADEPSKPEA